MIRLEKDGAVWVAILDRPEKANALTKAMLTDLADIAEDATGKAQTLILTGSGKVFSAGMDLAAAKAGLASDPVWERLSGVLIRAPYMSIAALNGTLAGGAFGMALACDLRICVSSAQFFYPVMKLGFLPQPSDPARMAALVGAARAKMILMAGQKILAKEALDWGLVQRITAPEDLLDTARMLAADTLVATPEHSAAIKALIP